MQEVITAIQAHALPRLYDWLILAVALLAIIVSGLAAYFAYSLNKKQSDILEQQNRIALFDKRYEIYNDVIFLYNNLKFAKVFTADTSIKEIYDQKFLHNNQDIKFKQRQNLKLLFKGYKNFDIKKINSDYDIFYNANEDEKIDIKNMEDDFIGDNFERYDNIFNKIKYLFNINPQDIDNIDFIKQNFTHVYFIYLGFKNPLKNDYCAAIQKFYQTFCESDLIKILEEQLFIQMHEETSCTSKNAKLVIFNLKKNKL